MSNEGIFDKVKDFLKGHPEQADQGLDRAGDLVNERTGGKYSDQIAKGDDMVRQQLGVPDEQAETTQPAPGGPVVPPAPDAAEGTHP
jgi:hypothetical protein